MTLSYTDNAVTVTVGGFDAHVTFAGLAPGYVGLYQVNAIVPSGVSAGPSVPGLVTAAGASKRTGYGGEQVAVRSATIARERSLAPR